MSRSTIFNEAPANYYQGEDWKQRPKNVSHLQTEQSFISTNDDLTLARPFSSPRKHQSKRHFSSDQHYYISDTPSKQTRLRYHPDTSKHFESCFDILKPEVAHDTEETVSPKKQFPKTSAKMWKGTRPNGYAYTNFEKGKRVRKIFDSSSVRDSMCHGGS
jgi:hypothetical protein